MYWRAAAIDSHVDEPSEKGEKDVGNKKTKEPISRDEDGLLSVGICARGVGYFPTRALFINNVCLR